MQGTQIAYEPTRQKDIFSTLEVSFFNRVDSKKPDGKRRLGDIFQSFVSDEYRHKIEYLRTLPVDEYKIKKAKLSGVTFSGTFTSRGNDHLESFTNLMCLDFDEIETPEQFRDSLKVHNWIYAAWISPSGRGIKCLVVIPSVDNDADYKKVFKQVQKVFPSIDAACSDLARLCFVSWDPNLWINHGASMFELSFEYFEEVKPRQNFSSDETPLNAFNRDVDFDAFISNYQWKLDHESGDNKYYTRPGKDSGTSACWNEQKRLFYVFTSSTQLEAARAYSPAALLCYLEYAGDFSETAKQLYSKNYGERHNGTVTQDVARPPKVSPPPIDGLRMTFRYKKKNATPALLLNETTLINFGEIFVIVGLPGQGKTAICESIVCAHRGKDPFGFTFNNNGKKVLLIDTERHPDDVSDSYHNIFKRLGKPALDEHGEIEGLIHLSLAEFGKVDELKAILERETSSGHYSLVILDGIIDFATSMNDDKDATDLVKWVRMLAVKYNCAIVVTIHPNKGSESIAGHLGAFLYRWARAILYVRTVKGDKAIKELTGEPDMAKLSHGGLATLAPVYFSWDAELKLLMPCDFEPQQDRGKVDKMCSALEVVFANDKRYRHGELVKAIKGLGHSESTAKRWITSGVTENLINNAAGIYSGSGSGSGFSKGSPPFIEGGVNLNLENEPLMNP